MEIITYLMSVVIISVAANFLVRALIRTVLKKTNYHLVNVVVFVLMGLIIPYFGLPYFLRDYGDYEGFESGFIIIAVFIGSLIAFIAGEVTLFLNRLNLKKK